MLLLAVLVTLVQAWPVVRETARAFGTDLAAACGCGSAAAFSATSMTLGLVLFALSGCLLLSVLWRALALWLKTRTFSLSFSARAPSGKLRAAASELELSGRVMEISGRPADVFCAGLFRPRLYVSSRAVDVLTDEELRAVLAHERIHLERRDPLRMFVSDAVMWFIRFLPGLQRMHEEFRAGLELAADEAAIERLGSVQHLSRALLRLLPSSRIATRRVPVGVAYFGATDRRIEHLLGEQRPPSRRMFVVFALVGFLALIGAGLGGLRVRAIAASADQTAIVQCRQVRPACEKPKTLFPTWMSTEVTLTSAR